DFNLRLGLIENCDELANRVNIFFHVRDDQRIAATIDFDRATSRKPARDDGHQSLIAAAAGRIATSATTKTQVCGTAPERTGRTGCLGQCARSTRIVESDEFGNEW